MQVQWHGSPGQLGLRVTWFLGHWVAGSQNVTQFHVWLAECNPPHPCEILRTLLYHSRLLMNSPVHRHRRMIYLKTCLKIIWTCSRFFSRFSFFSSYLFRFFLVFLISRFYLSHNTVCFWIFFSVLHNSTSISVSFVWFPLKTFSVRFSLCARLNEQLACQVFSANHLSYYIILS